MVEAALPNARAALADQLERVANRCLDAITHSKVDLQGVELMDLKP